MEQNNTEVGSVRCRARKKKKKKGAIHMGAPGNFFVELGNLNSGIWYALSVAKLPTERLHAALQHCATFSSIFVTCG